MTACPTSVKRISFIVNPHAGRGSVGRRWPYILKMARERWRSLDFSLTSGPGEAALFAREAVLNGAEVVVCVGGDGTLNEVVTGMMNGRDPLGPGAVLGLIPNGTGCDFVRTLRIPREPDEALEVIAAMRTQPLDLGRLSYTDHEGGPAVRYFHNVTSFGLGGEVDERVNRSSKVFGGFLSFVFAALCSVLRYRKKRIRLRIDDSPEEQVTAINVIVGNGQYHGGGMWVAPGASVSDGLFHITIIGEFSIPEVFWHFPKLYNGKLLLLEKVRTLIAKRIEAQSDERVLLDVDGEQVGTLPATAEIVPGAVRLIVP